MVIESDQFPDDPVASFEEFFRTFEDQPNHFKYRLMISEAYSSSSSYITVLFEDILNFDPQLAHYLRNSPDKALEQAIDAFKNILAIDAGGTLDYAKNYEVRISTLNNSNEVLLRNLRSAHVEKLVYVKGIVIKMGPPKPQIVVAQFQCSVCQARQSIIQKGETLTKPEACSNPNCTNKKKFDLLQDLSEFIDYQRITIQEPPEDLPPGAIPRTIPAILKYGLVDTIRPGDRIKSYAIYRSLPVENNRGKEGTVFAPFLEINNIEKMKLEDEEGDVTQEDIVQIVQLSRNPNIQRILVNSIAPSIYGNDHLKIAALLSLFGGVQKKTKGGSKIRGDIHVLFMGDPGTGKSQILQFCSKLIARSVYTSGKGASAAGLTAAVIRESDNSGYSLEAGALVLASGGIACTTEDSCFILENGDLMTFKELFEGIKEPESIIYPKFKVMALNEQTMKIEPFAIKKAFRIKNSRKILKIQTRSGRTIKLTDDNELLVAENSKAVWKECGKLNRNDYIAVPKNVKINKQNDYTADFAYLAGLIASDGHIQLSTRRGRVEFYNSDLDLIDTYKRLLEKLGFEYKIYIRKVANQRTSTIVRSKKDNYQIYTDSKIIAEKLVEFGIPSGNKSSKYALSQKIFSYSDEIISNFLKGILDGDGSVRSNPNEIFLSNGIKENVQLFQRLLLRLGIASKISESTREWHCEIIGTENCLKFLTLIGSNHKMKYERLKMICNKEMKDRIDVLPNHQKFFESIKNENRGQLGADFYKYIWNYCKEGVTPSRFHLSKINEVIHNDYLQKFIESDILWDKIIDIEEVQSEYVYDFTMDGTNNFIANFIIMHNCIDEFDKMEKNDRSAIHQAMEQQSISISKAGINATLQSQTAIIAAANPKFGRYNPFKTPTDNINLPAPILSRFDLVFIVQDKPNPDSDSMIADFIINTHMGANHEDDEVPTNQNQNIEVLPVDLLRKYIRHARNSCFPKLTKEAGEKIKEFYLSLRGLSGGENNAVAIVARYLEGLIRMSEAFAKMSLRDFVTVEDAEKAIELMNRSMREIGLDPATGKLDVDRLITGTSQSQVQRLELLLNLIKEMQIEKKNKPIKIKELIERAVAGGQLNEEFVLQGIEILVKESTIYNPRNDEVKLMMDLEIPDEPKQ